MVAGGSGLGKTSLLTHIPRPLFLMDSQETGLLDLMQKPGLVPEGVAYGPPVSEWTQLMAVLDTLISYGGPAHNPWGAQSIVSESITGFERMMFEYACSKDWGGNWDRFMDYSKGPKQAAKRYWSSEFLFRLTLLRDQGYHVALTAHTQVKAKDNADGLDFVGEIAYCDAAVWQQTHRWAEAVLWLSLSAVIESNGSTMKAAKSQLEGQRMLHFGTSPVYPGKNRWDVSGCVNISKGAKQGWESFCHACGIDPRTFYFK